MTATCIPAAIYEALSARDIEAATCLIRHLATTDPEAAQRIRDAIEQTEARLRAKRGALEARDYRDYRDEMDRDYWEGAPE